MCKKFLVAECNIRSLTRLFNVSFLRNTMSLVLFQLSQMDTCGNVIVSVCIWNPVLLEINRV